MRPNCPDHQQLMLQLALGLLPDQVAGDAETVRKQCNHCNRWWHEHLEGRSSSDVERGVAQAFSSFRSTPQLRFGKWLPVAVAAVLVLTVGLGLRSLDPQTEDNASPTLETVLAQENWEGNFEEASTFSMIVGGASTAGSQANSLREADGEAEPLFEGNLESADLSSWSSHG